MSNAAVINATNTSGLTAGTPFTIDAGGDVVLKAFGSGSGAWSATLAFAPYVNGLAGSPITLSISSENPSARTSTVTSSDTQWVGWVTSHAGTWEASGIVEGYQPDEALANDLGVFVDGAEPTKAIKEGASYRTTSGSAVVWRDGVGWIISAKAKNAYAHANRPISIYGGSSVVASDRTVALQICADGEFGGFRLRLHNFGNAALTVGPVVATVAADSGATGTDLTWVPVLFGGQSTVVIPASTSYASGGDVEFTVADSDYVFLSSVARADGTKYPILQVRVYYPNGGSADTGSGSDTLAMTNSAFPAGKRVMSARAAGNSATYPTAPGMTLSDSTITYSISPAEVEFSYTTPIISIAGFGDSISNGVGDAVTPLISPLAKAVITLNGADAPRYSWAQFAQSAQSHAKTTNNCIATLAALRPSIVRIPTFSPNDGAPTAILMQRFFANTMRMIEASTKACALFYLVGPPPCWNGAHEAIITGYIAKITAWCAANGVAYLDSRAILQDPENPGKYLPAYNSGDNVHPSAAGRDALAVGDALIISALS